MGCNVWGSILQKSSAINQCNSVCITKESVVNGSCTGHGCCESPLPSSRVPLPTTALPSIDKLFFITLHCDDKHLDLMSYGMRTYGFVVEDGSYDFIESDPQDFNRNISMKLEWSIGEGNCSQAMESNSSLCAENSYCIKSKRGYGYRCKCLQGYQGNPYLPGTLGCQDIDECSARSNLCVPKATCQNRVPGYACIDDGSTVAIKKSYAVAQNQVHQFIEEILILTQIDHKNIARLLGCCLETQVPFLVYEFISGDTLYQKLHGDADDSTPLSWKSRLQIATEIAEALSHLHSCASMPIVHRDVKSSNILLDKNHEAKLIDFGVSRFIPQDKNWVLTVLKGTRVYLDPEYFETGNLTEKSDVYSFGVVLVELLFGQAAIQHEQTQAYNILVTHFLSCVERRDLFKIVDEGILREGGTDDLQATMEIARRCLSFKGEERPTVKEVQKELALLIR
ncbi:wall-associated receptor kinase 5-like [Magnolia sinica]|uniref:wall-associated receptor kinase 5-like n=1 Tax=Magnolia sinica TaxID=86752 RepID=UPI0026580895|nr:wall-associated receptor kinase 5-like [Magnolia sinica]